jgi:hypothetical protein
LARVAAVRARHSDVNREAPPNDNFANASALSRSSGSIGGTTVAATTEACEPAPSGGYRFEVDGLTLTQS